MRVKDFKAYLIANNIPDDAEIVIWADHAQNYERVHDIWVSRNTEDYYEAMIWEFDGYEDIYDSDAFEDYPADGPVVAICIEGAE